MHQDTVDEYLGFFDLLGVAGCVDNGDKMPELMLLRLVFWWQQPALNHKIILDSLIRR